MPALWTVLLPRPQQGPLTDATAAVLHRLPTPPAPNCTCTSLTLAQLSWYSAPPLPHLLVPPGLHLRFCSSSVSRRPHHSPRCVRSPFWSPVQLPSCPPTILRLRSRTGLLGSVGNLFHPASSAPLGMILSLPLSRPRTLLHRHCFASSHRFRLSVYLLHLRCLASLSSCQSYSQQRPLCPTSCVLHPRTSHRTYPNLHTPRHPTTFRCIDKEHPFNDYCSSIRSIRYRSVFHDSKAPARFRIPPSILHDPDGVTAHPPP